MRKIVQIIGLILAADGLLTATFSKDYLKVWRTDRFGREYLEFIDSYSSLPANTLRVIGFAETLIGSAIMFFTGNKETNPSVSGHKDIAAK